jgi:hypothetical protein
LDRQRLILRDAKPDHLTLRVEGIEVDVRDDAQRAGSGIRRELGQVSVGEP